MQCLSYAYGQGEPSLMYTTLPALLKQRACETPHKAAHIFRHPIINDERKNDPRSARIVITFEEMAERSFNIACSLLDTGVKPGDRVTVIGHNCPQWIFLDYACLRIGALLIKIPSNFTSADELKVILQQTNSVVLVIDQVTVHGVLDTAFPNILDMDQGGLQHYGLGSIKQIIVLRDQLDPDDCSLNSISKMGLAIPSAELGEQLKEFESNLCPDDAAIVLQTSGTTGKSKSVVYSHFSYINSKKRMSIANINMDSIVFNDRPFSWIGSNLYQSVITGDTIVHVDPAVTVEGDAVEFIFDVLREEKITCAHFMPYLLYDIMTGIENGIFSLPPTLKYIFTGGELIPSELIAFAKKSFHSFIIGYGSSETTGAVSFSSPELGLDSTTYHCWYKLSPLVELKILEEKGNIVPVGELGQIYVRSPYAMLGYLTGPASLDSKFRDPWIKTGDLGLMREDGQFKVIGRTTDVISRGTVKVYPKTLENILCKHEDIDKVKVFRVPDPRLYQEVCASVVPRVGKTLQEAELKEFFNKQIHADAVSFAPKYYLIIDKLPTGSTGKYDGKALRKLAIEHFNLSTVT